MKTKEIKITPPEGYEIDKENSTFECIKFKEKLLTYDDIVYRLFDGKKCYYIQDNGKIQCADVWNADPNNATSEKQLEKLLAINKLMNVAKYLNGDWKPDWSDECEDKWYIAIEHNTIRSLKFNMAYNTNSHITYFQTKALVQQAIDILGEDTICLALSTDW